MPPDSGRTAAAVALLSRFVGAWRAWRPCDPTLGAGSEAAGELGPQPWRRLQRAPWRPQRWRLLPRPRLAAAREAHGAQLHREPTPGVRTLTVQLMARAWKTWSLLQAWFSHVAPRRTGGQRVF